MAIAELSDISSFINLKLFFEEKHIFELYVRWFGVQIKILYAFLIFPCILHAFLIFPHAYYMHIPFNILVTEM
jgi:hypothetical protein